MDVNRNPRPLAVAGAMSLAAAAPPVARAAGPLPSRADAKAERAILALVEKVTKRGTPDLVPPEKRIATPKWAVARVLGDGALAGELRHPMAGL